MGPARWEKHNKTEESRTTCRFLGKAMIVVHSPKQGKEQDWDEGIEKYRIVNPYIMNTYRNYRISF